MRFKFVNFFAVLAFALLFFVPVFNLSFEQGYYWQAALHSVALKIPDNFLKEPEVLAEESDMAEIQAPELSYQDQLDEIQEKLDVIAQQVQELIEEQNPSPASEESPEPSPTPSPVPTPAPSSTPEPALTLTPTPQLAPAQAPIISGGGGPAPIVYPKILISEVKISPIDQRFVEFYNPNDSDVALADWYLQRKDANDESWNSFISHTKFAGKTILAKSYFLVAKNPEGADLQFDLILTDNNSLALKNPNGEISDQLVYSTFLKEQSFGRKNDTEDFEIEFPTPKAKNQSWIDPTPDPTPTVEPTPEPTPEPSPTPTPTPTPDPTPIPGPNIILYTLQVADSDPTSENNVTINSSNGVKLKINVDEPVKFKIWIGEKEYWYTTTFATSITRPSSCDFWQGIENSCSGDILPNGDYLIKVEIEDEEIPSNKITDTSKTITIQNEPPA